MPPNSNSPTPRFPRDQDEWIAILVALGVLGGTAGWILFSGIPTWQLGASGRDQQDIDIVEQPDPPLTGRSPSASPSSEGVTSDRLSGLPPQGSPTGPEQPETPGRSPVPSQGDTVPGQSPSIPSHAAESPSPSVMVPAPRVPDEAAVNGVEPLRDPLAFSDVPDTHWAKPYIDSLTAQGILNGLPDGSFAPDRPMTRAELATQIAQAFDMKPQRVAQPFIDIPQDYWATETINEAVTTGFMKGYPEQVFRPDETVPRLQVLVALATGLSLPEPADPESMLQALADQGAIPDWARDKVAAAIAAGLITVPTAGSGQLRPTDPTTRAEFAVILHNALAYLGRVEPVD